MNGDGIRIAGWIVGGAGIVMTAYAFTLKVSLNPGLDSLPGPLSNGLVGAEVVNAGLMQKQMMVLQCGLAASIAGAILIAAGLVVQALGQRDSG